MPNLVIVESPSKAITIKNYLGAGYKVVSSVGHIRDLPKSTLGVDIENGFAPHYINIRGKGPLIKELKKDVKNANVVYLATDADREGEAISWHLATALEIPPEKTKRVTFNEVTKKAVKAGIRNPRGIDMDLVNSQQARRILDRIVGYKLSPFLWKTVKSGLSAGRVQSVATRIIVERENEIRAFVPTEFWTITAFLETEDGGKIKAKFFGDENGKIELPNEAEAKKILASVIGNPFTVAKVRRSVKMKNPQPPFITSTLQQEASRKLNFQSTKIMKVAQELYEGINLGPEHGGINGLITYMRTDSLRVSEEAQAAAKTYIINKFGAEYYPKTPRVYKSKANAQDAHEAIRPVNMELEPDKIKDVLSKDQYKLYKLIWDRFVASQMESAKLDTVSADIESNGYIFKANGYTIKFPGYMTVYEEGTDGNGEDPHGERTTLPAINDGDKLIEKEVLPEQHFTEPPPRYTEATLVKFLEEKGIGRPSTYASIISTIITRGYVAREGKSLKPTQLGEITTKLMIESFPNIVDYKFTAKMENELDDIANGSVSMLDVLNEFYKDFSKSLDRAFDSVSKVNIEIPPEETDIICEKCNAKMIIKSGRFGKFAACPNYPECKNTKPLDNDGKTLKKEAKEPEMTDIPCDLCGAPLVIRHGAYGSFYACSNYPKCKFTKQIANEIGVKCPLCGANVITKRGKRKTVFYSCERYPDCTFSSWDLPLNEKCPKCGNILYKKKGKNQIICKSCDYKREAEKE